MSEEIIKETSTETRRVRVLLVDDEERFREAIKKQLTVRGYKVLDVDNGEDAIKTVRHMNPEVVILDQKMPKMDGIQALKEIKKIRPEVQVIMLTGFGCTESARLTGKHDVFRYMQKPCNLDELIENIEAARQERIYAMARHEIPDMKKSGIKEWLVGVHNMRPGFIILGLLLFLAVTFMKTPENLMTLVTAKKTEVRGETIAGYSDYRKMKPGQTVHEYFADKTGLNHVDEKTGETIQAGPEAVTFRAKVMLGTLVISAIFWATGALPLGITAFLACALMYGFGVLPPDQIVKAHAKDAVLFIIGVLALSQAIGKTGLDKRIGIVLLGTSKSLAGFLFVFAPLFAMTASFLSEHALVAFVVPVLMVGYSGICKASNIKKDPAMVVMLLLVACFAANVGGPGSPAAGGRNAVMIGILADYGVHISFGEWVKYGLPFVPVMALTVAGYFFIMFRGKLKVKNFDLITQIRRETDKIGKMTKQEYITAAVLVVLITMLITLGEDFGMGGPFILAVVVLNICGILTWKDVNGIHWDVAALYASASAMGGTLALTGGSLWIASSFMDVLPEYFRSGVGLAISSSFFSGILTNFMSDGATVASIGPITVPMATLSGTSPVMVGLATAFASSFAHAMIIGTPNNAIAFSMAKDPETGEQLLSVGDFMKHGVIVLILSFAVLWGWCFFGYWQWLGF